MSALTVFITVFAGCMLTALAAGGGSAPNKAAWTVSLLTALLATMKDIRATMSLPPLSNGNYEAIKNFMQGQTPAPGNYAALKTFMESQKTTEQKDSK